VWCNGQGGCGCGQATHAISTPLPNSLPTRPQGQKTSHALHVCHAPLGMSRAMGSERRYLQNLQYWHLQRV
jgi:hypothetical protein